MRQADGLRSWLKQADELGEVRTIEGADWDLEIGGVADITVIDPDIEWTVMPEKFLSKSRNTPFAGMRLKGRAVLTIVGGEIVFDGRKQ